MKKYRTITERMAWATKIMDHAKKRQGNPRTAWDRVVECYELVDIVDHTADCRTFREAFAEMRTMCQNYADRRGSEAVGSVGVRPNG